jgi:hypothetical protein
VFSRSISDLFTTSRRSQFFCSCIASIIAPDSELRSHVIVRPAELKACSKSQLVHGMERKSVAILKTIRYFVRPTCSSSCLVQKAAKEVRENAKNLEREKENVVRTEVPSNIATMIDWY